MSLLLQPLLCLQVNVETLPCKNMGAVPGPANWRTTYPALRIVHISTPVDFTRMYPSTVKQHIFSKDGIPSGGFLSRFPGSRRSSKSPSTSPRPAIFSLTQSIHLALRTASSSSTRRLQIQHPPCSTSPPTSSYNTQTTWFYFFPVLTFIPSFTPIILLMLTFLNLSSRVT